MDVMKMGEYDRLSKKLKNIKDNYPKAYWWVQSKAKWEHQTLMDVLRNNECWIDEQLNSVDSGGDVDGTD